MKFERLGEKITQVRGISYKPKDISAIPQPDYVPVLRANNIQEDGINTNDMVYIHKSKVKPEQFIKKGDLLLAASSGSKEIVGKNIYFEGDFTGSFGAFCKLVRPSKNITPRYLATFFKSVPYKRHIRKLLSGALINNLKNEHIDSLLIPDISDSDQLHIANLLTKAENLVNQRKESIRLLDEYLKSTFLEMFGDPVKNEKGWELYPFSEIVAKDCPLTYGIVQPGNEFPNGVPVIRPVDLIRSTITRNGLKLIDPKISGQFKRTILKGGELLMCVRGTTGVVSIASTELAGCNVTRGITPIWFSKNYSSSFAYGLFQTQAIKNRIQELTYGATLKQINLGDLRKIKLINPPIKLQNQFAQIVEKTEILKTQHRQSLQELENLYASLSQKAFKGELKKHA